MKKIFPIFLLLLLLSFTAKSNHITGGEMFYTYVGVTGGMHQYHVTLKLYQRCNSGRQFPNPTIISIFNKTNNTRVNDLNVALSSTENITLTNTNPCITNPPLVCYDVAYYQFTVSLPSTAEGYVLASQINYRINGISNLQFSANNVGATYTAEIPGTNQVANGSVNNSANFTGSDLVVVCANNNFSYSFAAADNDGDQLRYSFCEAYASTASAGGGTQATQSPPFPSIPYNYPDFTETTPLGNFVQIDQNTGLITGIAPDVGVYVVTVCVDEIRNGKVIARQRKDLQINIADCDIAAASLLPEYYLCDNTQTINITNRSVSNLIVSTDWQLFDPSGNLQFSSSAPVLNYTFPSIGNYTIKLFVNKNQACSDSTSAIVRVFPGFVPDFDFNGKCITKPSFFTDRTTSVYGVPNSWNWDFGELATTSDFSSLQNPTYTYPVLGVKNIRLIVTDSRGCRDTAFKSITIIDKPPVNIKFRDTLICLNDILPLQANGVGNYSWTPLTNIINPLTASPTVSPATTTTYYVTLDDNGCINNDSVTVRVVDQVSLQVMKDSTICSGDTIQLSIISDGLLYQWTPSNLLVDPNVKVPSAITNSTTNYQVLATIGGCNATKDIVITAIPYPVVNAGIDLILCYNNSVQLNGTSNGTTSIWTPSVYVSDPQLLKPRAFPPRTTIFILSAYDTLGCPKPGRDSLLISVLPKMNISAGRDTTIVMDQPLQLNATGGIGYNWSPPDYLSDANIPDPLARFSLTSEDIKYKVVGYSTEGCKDSAFIAIKVFKTGPSVFVPTAFTPNNDGLNDILRPLSAGILNIDYFNIYNRWGQLLFSTRSNGKGWDGRINGVPQTTGIFVWTVKATDYNGKPYFQKGLVTLIR